MDILDITFAWSVYLVFAGVLSILIGRYARNKISLEHWMLFGYALNTIGTFGYLFVYEPASLFIVQIVLGTASALATPTWDALYATHESKKKAGSEWGIADGGPQIVTGIAVVVGGFIVTFFGFTALFLTMGIIQIIATVVQAKILST